MKLKRVIAFALSFVLLISFVPALAEEQASITIAVTDTNGSAVSSVNEGEVIKVTVNMTDFPNLSMTSPSLHFNPGVVKICDENGNILTTAYENNSFYEAGTAITSGWRGEIQTISEYYPFFNNETGVIGMFADNLASSDLVGTQSVYSVYMKAVGTGSADIRLSKKEDGNGKVNPAEYYDYALYLGETPNYVFFSGTMNPAPLPAITVTPSSPTIYTTVQARETNVDWCCIGDKFEVKIYVKNIESLMSVNLPVLYDILPTTHAVMLDMDDNIVTPLTDKTKIITINPKFSLLTNGQYPRFDVDNRFSKILLTVNRATTPTGILKMNKDENTWLCTLKFQATAVGKFEQSANKKKGFAKFATSQEQYSDPMSPTGALITDENAENPQDTAIMIFPVQQNAPFEIIREKSKTPEKIVVIPNVDNTATVIVIGVRPGADVTIYDKETGTSVKTAPADSDGNAVFANVPLENTTDNRIWADAIEPDKSVSDKNSGIPGVPPIQKVLVSLEPLDLITVENGTSKDSVLRLMPSKLIGKIGYTVNDYDGVFVMPDTVELSPDTNGFVCDTYSAAASAVYNFLAAPDLTGTGLIFYQNTPISAKQPVYVKPKSGSTSSGGGGGGSYTALSTLIINCLNEKGEIIYTQRVEKVQVGKEQSVNAPDLKGYDLAEGETSPKKVNILSGDTIVEFKYVKKAELNKTDHYRYILGYPDGSVQPEGNITREEVAAIFYRLLTKDSRKQYRKQTSTFPDVLSNRWSSEEIATIQNAKVIEGRDTGVFDPGANITRAEFATMAMRFDKLKEGDSHTFTDISGHWAEKYIASAVQKGWIVGYPDNTFKPDQPITRTEAMTLINRVLERSVDKDGLLDSLKIDWPDLSLEHWGYFEVQEATVSHLYDRREDGKIVENWTGGGEDVNFDIDE